MREVMLFSARILSVIAASTSVAIGFADAFDERTANVALLQDKRVQTDLKISEAQRKKMNTHAEWFNKEAEKIRQAWVKSAQGKNPPPAPPQAKMQALEQSLKSRVFKELSQTQIKRLREITVQQAGVLALLDDSVAKKIGLSATQVSALKARFKSNAEKAQKLQTAAINPINAKYKDKKPKDQKEAQALQAQYGKEIQAAAKKIEPQITKLRKEFETFVGTTLSASQKSAWSALKGKPFSF